MGYGQFCPIAKALDILGERWTLLILRELIVGGRRFNELQRGLGMISPALLTKRLTELEKHGLVAKRRIPGQRGYEYFPTSCAEALQPTLFSLGEWGMQWAKENLVEEDFDVDLLMLYLQRSIDYTQLVGRETVIRFEFTDLKQHPLWWLVVNDDRTEVCVKDPGRDVDIFFQTKLRTMCEVWLGHDTYRRALKDEDLSIVGPTSLTRNVTSWLRCSPYTSPEDCELVLT
ncbi:winged helix-turn-helix transcriptional regulator [Emcibacter sp.]|uniref:winged helix-turn-helix transcriptional regulator n=1 Tax=Emcibacter sp. TaxID=1979954 RepID=UPI003A900B00